MKMDTDGNGIWALQDSNNYSINKPAGISIDSNDDLLICGRYDDFVTLGGFDLNAQGNGSPTFYMAKIGKDPISGIHERQTDLFTISIFPNPTTGKINLSPFNSEVEVRIFNSSGSVVAHKHVEKHTASIFHCDIPGIYYVQATTKDFAYSSKLIVIK